MAELSDDDFDETFRRLAKEHHLIGDPGDWENLKKRLDIYDQNTRKVLRRRKIYYSITGIILFTVIGLTVILTQRSSNLFDIQISNHPDAKKRQKTTGHYGPTINLKAYPPKSISQKTWMEISQDETQNRSAPRRIRNLEHKKENQKDSTQKSKLGGTNLIAKKNGLYSNESKQPSGKIQKNTINSLKERLQKNTDNIVLSPSHLTDEYLEDNAAHSAQKYSWLHMINVTELPIKPIKEQEVPYASIKYASSVANLEMIKREDNTGSFNKAYLSARIVLSPDISTVMGQHFTQVGLNAGLLAEYRVSKRWSLQTGVIKSTKNYRALAKKYEWGNKPWAVQPESVQARCKMFDIPINVRYDLLVNEQSNRDFKNRWFVSAGATTYYKMKERYQYNYANPSDPTIKYRNWDTESGTFGFSHANVSIGFERRITKNISIQAEPFVKIPLKGIGFYNMNLISAGTFFSISYKF